MSYREAEKGMLETKDRCAVSDYCDGICRELHLQEGGVRCPAWYTDDMDRRKKSKRKR